MPGPHSRPFLLIAILILISTSACDLMGAAPTATPASTSALPTVPDATLGRPTATTEIVAEGTTPIAPPTATMPPTATTPPLPTSTSAPTPTSPPTIPKGGTLTVRLQRDVTTLNPLLVEKSATDIDRSAALVTGAIFSGLTRIDDQMRPQPDLAESWTIEPTGLSIIFKLRAGVKWHDGQPVTPEDVIFTYNTLLSLPYPTPLQFQLRDAVIQIDSPAADQVRFFLKKPVAAILGYVSAPILPKHLLADVAPDQMATAQFNFNPVGSGPYKFSEHNEGENVVLVANPDYYGGAPNISRLAFLVAPDEAVTTDALNDDSLMLGEVQWSAWQTWSAAPGALNLGRYPDQGYYFVAFNLRQGHAFSDRRLRQAWAYALNKDDVVASATSGAGLAEWTDVAPFSWAYAPNVPHLNNDPDRARQLLEEAGWIDADGDGIRDQNGEPLRVPLYVRADDAVRLKAAQAMVEPLAAVGIGVTISPVDFQSVLRAKLDPTLPDAFDWHVLLMGWDSASYDPDSFALFHSSQILSAENPAGLNYVGFASQEYDELAFNAREQYDSGQRALMYERMQQIISEELPYYFLWSDSHFLAINNKVKGPIDLNSPRYLWNVEQWWIEP